MTDQTEHIVEKTREFENDGRAESSPVTTSDFSTITRNGEISVFGSNVFLVDETAFRSSIPKVSHWSIAWSDLMMTMFILFLSMFVYQAAHKEFLVSDQPEVIGGTTTEALDILEDDKARFPFVPIEPARPLIAGGTVKKVEPVKLEDIDPDSVFFEEDKKGGLDRIREQFKREQQQESYDASQPPGFMAAEEATPRDGRVEASPEDKAIDRIFSLSNDRIAQLGLDDFASIDLVQDKTMRIVLTGDLLFATGEAELNDSSRNALITIAEAIRDTPYMINVVGHTDNIPMHSERYATNWELSVARASTVARFLVEVMGMDPQQFVVSGFSSYRPIKPNTNAKNRAANRRVELIISKRLPSPVAVDATNL